MTSPLRRKRPITARGSSTLTRTASSLAALTVLLGGGLAGAQDTAQPHQATYPAWSVPPPPVVQSGTPSPVVAAQPAASPVRPTALQGMSPETGGMGIIDYQIQTEPPGLDRLSRVETEADLFQRIRQENLARGERVVF